MKPAGIVAAVASLPIRRRIEQRRVVVLAAVGMFIAVFLLRQTSSDSEDVIALLPVVPVALVALEFGLRVGIAAGLVTFAFVGLVALDVHSGSVGLSAAALAYLAMGAVAGRFGDRMRDAHARQHLLLESGLALAHLDHRDDISARLVKQAQALSAPRNARVELDGAATPDSGVPRQGEERFPIEVRDVHYGTLVVSGSRPLGDEDRATMATLALQAAVAAENRRLLELERERAVIRAELQEARISLDERGSQVRELIARTEAERGQVADELHEDAAQMLAAVLLGLGALERELGSGDCVERLGELRSDVTSTLRSLRSLAVSLRPPALRLGLQTALEELGAGSSARGFEQFTVALGDAQIAGPEVETMVYRAVEEALEAVGAAERVSVRTGPDGGFVIDVQGARREIAPERLMVLRARIDLAGGTLLATPSELRAIIPPPTPSAERAEAA